MTRALPVLLAFAASVLVLLLVLARIDVRTDMAEFLPRGETDAARLVLDEARSGASTGLILVGIEGAPQAELARIAGSMQAALPGTGLFQTVAGGRTNPADPALLFTHRYALSAAATPDAFTAAALHTALEGLLQQLRGSAAPLVTQYGLADPPGAFLALVRSWAGTSAVRSIDGAWFDPAGTRALLLARTRAGGMDIPAQDAALAAIQATFRAADPGPARLRTAGPAVFAHDAAHAIRSDVERISVASTLLVVALLWWRFRSPLVLAAIAAPVVLSVAIAALVVQAVFGMVHGVALGFGATMLGVSVDYPVLMIGHRKRHEAAPATRARIGRAFVLAVLSALLGLGAMVGSGFPGLMQLGVFAAAGLAACAVLTWTLLPALIVRANLAPVEAGDPAWLVASNRGVGIGPGPCCPCVCRVVPGREGPRWEGDLQALSPVPEASRALDREMRAQIGAPETGTLLLVQGTRPSWCCARRSGCCPRWTACRPRARCVARSSRHGCCPAPRPRPCAPPACPTRPRSPPGWKPPAPGCRSARRRCSRSRTRWPRPAPPSRCAPRTSTAPWPVPGSRRCCCNGAAAGSGPLVLSGVTDPAAIAAAVQGSGAVFVDMRAELGGILIRTTDRAWLWLGGSAGVISLLLLAGLRDAGRTMRVLGAVAAALLVTVALLTAFGATLSLIHLVALQLVAGVGLDYALFYARRQLDAEERARTIRTLVTCNAMTLLTFGLLAGCQTPLLRDIGATVAIGALLAMGFAFLIVGEAPGEGERCSS